MPGGRCCGSPPGHGRGSHSASFCPRSDLPTGLSAVVGVTKQLEVDLGNTLDKVGHGADLREVCDIMFSWIRPVAVLTSQFFLSDEKGEMDMPSRINGGRASLQQ